MTPRNKNEFPVLPADPIDGTHSHVWVFEAPTGGGVLTSSGLENVANHKYVSGSYTHLDNFLNPWWTSLTECLPLWLAPNMVTTIGFLFCFSAYALVWYYSPNFSQPVPDWVIFFCGCSTFAYYTLDCMDGKQARRTGTSSPLGQLFDHGVDCICNLAQCSNTGAYTSLGGSYWYFLLQSTLQFSFFIAQWEEYYTHVLPHACGNWIGVTEVNYGLGLLVILNTFVDRESFWSTKIDTMLPSTPSWMHSLEFRHVGILGWTVMVTVLCSLSIYRVMSYVKSNSVRLSALSKLLSPLLLALSPFLLPPSIISSSTRYISLATGLLFSLITKKMIVYSMAKMSFGAIQLCILPYLSLCVWIRWLSHSESDIMYGVPTLVVLALACLFHAFLLLSWCKGAINQLCERLDIYCFTIKQKRI